jgi:iron(III) transport system permease protein
MARDVAAAIPERLVARRLDGEQVVRGILVLVFAAFLWFFVVYPMLHVLWRSLLDNGGRFVGLANYVRYVRTPAIAASITNSLVVSAAAMVLTVVLAFVYAYALARVRLPWRGALRVAAMLPLFAPSLVHGFALVYLFGNNGFVTRQTGINVGIYGIKGIVLAEVLYCFPHAVLILSAALAAADARLYDAAAALGAGRVRTFLTVTLPGVKYGVMSACFVVFTTVITDFGAPKVVGGKTSVMATEIYNQVIGQQNFTMGATVSVVLLIPALLAVVVDRIVQRRQYALISSAARPLAPGGGPVTRWALFVYCTLAAAAITAVYVVVLATSLVNRWPYDLRLTLKHYRFDTAGGYAALVNSLETAALTALIGTVIAFAGAYLVEKGRTPGRAALYLVSLLPVSIPGMVLGLAYIFVFNAPGSPLNRLYGTLTILVISNLVHYFTVPFLTATATLKQMDAEFEHVGASMGVPFYRTFWRVTVPLALPSLIGISMYFFLNAMVTLSAAVFLVAPGTELAAVAVLLMDDAGDTAQAAGMSVLIVAIGLAMRVVYWALLRGVSRAQAWQATGEPA